MRRNLTIQFVCGFVLCVSLPAYAEVLCDVSIAIEPVEQVSLGVVSVSVNYSAAYGTFVNGGSGVNCTTPHPDNALIANDVCSPDASCYAGSPRILVLVASSTRPEGVEPQLARCEFVSAAGREPRPEQFVVTTLGATELQGTEDVDVLPVAAVSAVSCIEGN